MKTTGLKVLRDSLGNNNLADELSNFHYWNKLYWVLSDNLLIIHRFQNSALLVSHTATTRQHCTTSTSKRTKARLKFTLQLRKTQSWEDELRLIETQKSPQDQLTNKSYWNKRYQQKTRSRILISDSYGFSCLKKYFFFTVYIHCKKCL